jgi:PAS domain S-box-containing protein
MEGEWSFLALVSATALLVCASVVFDLVPTDGPAARWGPWVQGLLLALMAVAALDAARTMGVGSGVVGPMILLLAAGLFFTSTAAGVAIVLGLAGTFLQAPDAAIVIPVAVGGLAGLVLRRRWASRLGSIGIARLILVGTAAGAFAAAMAVTVGADRELLRAGQVLVLAPNAMVVAGWLLSARIARVEDRRSLADAEERLRLAMDGSGQGQFDVDLTTGVVRAGGAYARMLGEDAADFHPSWSGWAERIHPDDQERVWAEVHRVESGASDRLEVEYRMRYRQGGWVWLRTTGHIVGRLPDGRPVRLVGTNEDVTSTHDTEERERRVIVEHERLLDEAVAARRALLSMVEDLRLAQQTLEESLERYMALVRHSPDAIIVNRDDRVALVNDAFLRLIGAHREDEVLGTNPVELFSAEDRPVLRQRIAMVRDAREPVSVRDFRILRRDGTLVDVEGAASPFQDHDGVAIHVVLRDISDRKQAERALVALNEELEVRVAERTAELQHAYRELESFSYSVSHDLRAPLRAITGFAQILERRHRDQLDETGRHYLTNISTAGERMGALIEDLLAYSRVGRRDVRSTPLDVPAIAANVFGTLGTRIVETGASVGFDGPAATPLGDPVLLEQILLNLVSNGITYAREGIPPDVSVTATASGDRVEVNVRDNGIGIASESHERVFEVFARLHAEDDIPGTGIGLAIVRKATRLMDGEVSLRSAPGEGSTFTISLPAAGPDPRPEATATQVPA